MELFPTILDSFTLNFFIYCWGSAGVNNTSDGIEATTKAIYTGKIFVASPTELNFKQVFQPTADIQ
jgi:hypothetical protein